MINMKQELKRIGVGLLFIIVFYSVVSYFQLSIYWVFAILLAVSVIMMVKGGSFTIKKFLLGAGYLAVFLGVLYYIRGLGTIGYVLGVFIICVAILWNKRKEFVRVKHSIEEMIWGKPLNEFMADKERPPKLKVTLLKQS